MITNYKKQNMFKKMLFLFLNFILILIKFYKFIFYYNLFINLGNNLLI